MKKLLLFFSLLTFSTQAQVSLNVSRNYPAHIVYKIDDVLSIVKLDEEKQIKIAKKFKKIDSLANISLSNGISVDQLKSYYTINNSFLKNILSQEELDRFAYEMDKDNRFLAALNSIPFTKLQSEQIKKIRQLNDSLDTTPKKILKETIQFQNLKLNKILNSEQYVALLQFIYKEQSITEAKIDWERILKLKINTPGKEFEELHKINEYHVNKNVFLDKQADRFEKKKRDFLNLKATMMETPLLIRAKILSDDKYANNKYASVIKYEKELNLNQKQIDSLLSKYLVFEKIIIENRENVLNENLIPAIPLPSEFEEIVKIITPEQTSKWLLLKNEKESIKKANESWAKMESEGLTKKINKQEIIDELRIYHIRLLIALEKAKNWKTRENLFLVRDVEQTKPLVLQQLDAIIRSKANNENNKNAMAW